MSSTLRVLLGMLIVVASLVASDVEKNPAYAIGGGALLGLCGGLMQSGMLRSKASGPAKHSSVLIWAFIFLAIAAVLFLRISVVSYASLMVSWLLTFFGVFIWNEFLRQL